MIRHTKRAVVVTVVLLVAGAAGIYSGRTAALFSATTTNSGNVFSAAASFGGGTSTTCTGIRTIAGGLGGGSATTIGQTPRDLAVDGDAAVLVVDNAAHTARRIDMVTKNEPVLAGDGTAGSSGDGGTATAAQLNTPSGIAVAANGTVYVADTANHRIRRVTAAGVISTFAGTGVAGSTGDGGAATAAQLSSPAGVVVDAAGNVYVADANNQKIRKIDTSGTITTIAGTGVAGAAGDGGPATAAQLAVPLGLAFDGAGNLYVAASTTHRIRRIDTSGTISTVAGTGTAGSTGDGGAATAALLSSPSDVAFDAAGSLYIADRGNHRIRKVTAAGVISTFAGTGSIGFGGDGGAATAATIWTPYAVAVDSGGNVYIADNGNKRVRRVTSAGTISTYAGTGQVAAASGSGGDGLPGTAAQLSSPLGTALDAAGNLYVADTGNHRIRRIDTNGLISTVAGTGTGGSVGDGGAATAAQLNAPQGVAFDAAGNLYIGDTLNNKVRKVTPAGVISTFAGTGVAGSTGDGGTASAARLSQPRGVATDAAGNVYVADSANNKIRRVTVGGIISTFAGTGTAGSTGDGGLATAARLSDPWGVAIDGSGNVYVGGNAEYKVRKVDAVGIISTFAGTGTFGYSGDGGPATAAQIKYVFGIAADAAGNLYIADRANYRIRRVDASGTITTYAGTGALGFAGDCGPPASATLNAPNGLSISGGRIYMSDTNNHRIRVADL
jgi:sugar lactone lactonase YvrE